jgi:nucleoside phosphorylase
VKSFDAGFDSVIASVVGNCINSYVLIRGIADYHNGSSRVARQWQPYAAANAAALVKVLIESLPSKK